MKTDVQVARAAYKAAFDLADIAYARAADAMRKKEAAVVMTFAWLPEPLAADLRALGQSSPAYAKYLQLKTLADEAQFQNKLAWQRVDKAKAALQVAMMARDARARERRRQVRLAEAELAEYEAIMQAVVDEVEQLAKGVANVQS